MIGSYLTVIGVTAAQWTNRYGVEAFSHPCSECGAMLTTSLPFASGTVRGLVAPVCGCGNDCTPYVVLLDDFARLAPLRRKQRRKARMVRFVSNDNALARRPFMS
jgi:hypothetical protein